MTDIVERLRSGHCPDNTGCGTQAACLCAALDDAAAEIERLCEGLRKAEQAGDMLQVLAAYRALRRSALDHP